MKRVVLITVAVAALMAPGAARADEPAAQAEFTCEGPVVIAFNNARTTSCVHDLVAGTRELSVTWNPGARGTFRFDVDRADGYSLASHACTFFANEVSCDTTGALEGSTTMRDPVEGAITGGQYAATIELPEDAVLTFTTDGIMGPYPGSRSAAGVIRLQGS